MTGRSGNATVIFNKRVIKSRANAMGRDLNATEQRLINTGVSLDSTPLTNSDFEGDVNPAVSTNRYTPPAQEENVEKEKQ